MKIASKPPVEKLKLTPTSSTVVRYAISKIFGIVTRMN